MQRDIRSRCVRKADLPAGSLGLSPKAAAVASIVTEG
jgi:hypothetical protein